MGTSNAIADYGLVLKTQWPQTKIQNLATLRAPLIQKIKKKEDVGKNYVLALQYGNGDGGGSAKFANAYANRSPLKFGGFLINPTPLYHLATIDGQALRVGRMGPKSAILDTFDATMKSASGALGRAVGWMLFGNGGGARGKVASFAGAVCTLTDPNQCLNFELGQVIGSSINDGTSGALKANNVVISGIDPDAGTLTASANWSTITGFAVADYLFRDGDFGAVPIGLDGWLPKTAPTAGDNFYGVDRSAYPTRLGGLRYTNPGLPMAEALQQMMARVARVGGMTDLIVMNPMDIVTLTIAANSKVFYNGDDLSKNVKVGAGSLKVISPMGEAEVVGDFNCPSGVAYGLQLDSWGLYSSGPAMGYLDDDGNQILREQNADQYTVRLGGYMAPGCDAPGLNIRGQLY